MLCYLGGGGSKSAGRLSFVGSLFAGVSSGALLVFDIPGKGSNITLSEVLEEHQEAITDLASECSGSQVRYRVKHGSMVSSGARRMWMHELCDLFLQECIADLVSADDGGSLCVWKSGEEFQLLNKISGSE